VKHVGDAFVPRVGFVPPVGCADRVRHHGCAPPSGPGLDQGDQSVFTERRNRERMRPVERFLSLKVTKVLAF